MTTHPTTSAVDALKEGDTVFLRATFVGHSSYWGDGGFRVHFEGTHEKAWSAVPLSALEQGDGHASDCAECPKYVGKCPHCHRERPAPITAPGAWTETRALFQQARDFAVLYLAFTGRDRGADRIERTLDGLDEQARKLDDAMRAALSALNATPGAPDTDADALRRYRAVTHWIGADSWDGCSACIERLRWATEADAGRDMSSDEIAVTMRDFRAVDTPPAQGHGAGAGWRKHDGKNQPVADDAIVDIEFSNGDIEHRTIAGNWDWDHFTSDPQVVWWRSEAPAQPEAMPGREEVRKQDVSYVNAVLDWAHEAADTNEDREWIATSKDVFARILALLSSAKEV